MSMPLSRAGNSGGLGLNRVEPNFARFFFQANKIAARPSPNSRGLKLPYKAKILNMLAGRAKFGLFFRVLMIIAQCHHYIYYILYM